MMPPITKMHPSSSLRIADRLVFLPISFLTHIYHDQTRFTAAALPGLASPLLVLFAAPQKAECAV